MKVSLADQVPNRSMNFTQQRAQTHDPFRSQQNQEARNQVEPDECLCFAALTLGTARHGKASGQAGPSLVRNVSSKHSKGRQMTRNLKTRIRRLEEWTDQKRFTVPTDDLTEIDQIIAKALVEIVEARFDQNAPHRFAMVLCVEVLERARQIEASFATELTEGNLETLCRDLIAKSSGGTVVFLGHPEAEF